MQQPNRRKLLKSTALGAIALSLGGTSVLAAFDTNTGDDHAACMHNHHALGHKLSTLIADPKVDEAVKNHAIKTASCPTCSTGIAPTGLGLAAKTWVS